MSDLSLPEIEALRDFLTQLSPNLSLALAEQVNREVRLESPEIQAVPIQDLLFSSETIVQTTFSLSQPLSGESVVWLSEATGTICTDLIEGNEGTDPPELLTDEQTEKLSGAMAGMLRGLATALTNMAGEAIEMEANAMAIGTLSLPPAFALNGNAIQARYVLNVPDILDTHLTFLFTPEFVRAFLTVIGDNDEAMDPMSESDSSIIGEDELAAMLSGLSGGDLGTPPAPNPGMGAGAPPPATPPPFNPFPTQMQDTMPRGLELLMDIPLDVTVELGRVRMLIKDVLELSSGSIVELDRVAGEPVDLLVNGRLVAKGEVVVIEDNFGIRITEIVSPVDRVAGLGRGR